MPLRTEIEKALAELISNEDGMKFQGLAVVLAKLKWPELIACERKKDLGLDAYVLASLAQDGIGKGLACSLTATLEKIKSDIDRFLETYKDIQVLIFYTPAKVTNQTAEKWASAVYDKFKLKLVTVSREDVIIDLMVPSNASICRSQLGIQITIEPSITDLITKTREAISETVQGWLSNPRLFGQPRIGLQAIKLDNENRETSETLDLSGLHAALQEGRRLVLEAPAGRGKTTTLIQLAEQHLVDGELPFLIDLPGWNRSAIDVLEFVASMREFRSRSISAGDLAKLFNKVHFSFLLNGWNEVPDTYSEQAVQAIRGMERSFPRAGIIVVTRSHHIKPPLPGSIQVKLRWLSRAQRTEYLEKRLAGRALELDKKLDEDRVLDDLTRTPLILSEVTTLFSSGREIPRTKIGVLYAMMDLIEGSDEHRHHLTLPPLSSHSREYLAELAAEMTKQGAVTIEESQARNIVNSVSLRLKASGEIAQLSEPLLILNALCAHHVLERLDYSPIVFKFEHQQFQEFLATIEVKRQLFALSNGDGTDHERRFAREYVNQPAWEESLLMIAEELGELTVGPSGSADSISAGRRLVKMALDIDPILAGELARLCGACVWQEVRTAMGVRFRNRYADGSGPSRQWALAGMLASGSEDFKDILLPLLSDNNQQIRLPTYRAGCEFHISCLGRNWRAIVGAWGEAQRASFVREVVQERWMAHVAEDFASSDPSPEVRTAALHALHWAGADITLAKFLAEADSQIFERALQEGLLDPLPVQLRARALSTYQSLLQSTADPVARLRIRLACLKVGGENSSERVKSDLSEWPPGRTSDTDYWLLKTALERVRKDDPHWVSHWLANRIIEGSLWSDDWAAMLLSIPETLRTNLFEKIRSQDLEYNDKSRIISVLAPTADARFAGDVFVRMCQLNSEISNHPREQNQTRWAIQRQLEGLYRAMPPEVAVSGLLSSLLKNFDQFQYVTTVELFGNISHEGFDIRDHVPVGLRQKLRQYLIDGLTFTLSQEDYDGDLKRSLALALARVGDPEDAETLHGLIRADIDRVRRGRAARSKGELGPLANGGAMGCSNWHVHAVVALDPSRGEEILLQILNEPEYELEAAWALLRMARTEKHEKRFGIQRPDYRHVWEARGEECVAGFNEDRRHRYALAIKERISGIAEKRSKNIKPESFTGRLKCLSNVLALLDGRNSSELIIENLALPQQWDEWTKVDTLEALLLSGAQLPAKRVLEVLNPVIDHALTTPNNREQADYLLNRCLCLLPFVESASEGIARAREINPTKRMWGYELQGLVAALGYSRCHEALGFLIEMAKVEEKRLDGIAGDWIDALANLGTPEAIRTLLSFVDPDIEQPNLTLRFDYFHQERLASRIANIAGADPSVRDHLFLLCTRKLPPQMRVLLADSVTRLGTRDAMFAGLNLMQDDATPSIPPALIRNLETVFVERRPYGGSENTYTLEPRSANDIRSRLFEMVMSGEARKNSAWRLLAQIESWRIEYGRPTTEPRHPNIDSGIPWPPTNLLADEKQGHSIL
jgi:hypothetical protein